MSANLARLLPNGDPQSGMKPSTLTNPEAFLTGDHSETSHTAFTNRQGNVTAGVWECAPCKEEIERYGVDELCTVISGSVTITGPDGHAETFGPGDSFAIGQDFKGTWHITETLKKFWMIVEPK
ncbi:MAG TPA: cupin domain-containing protein [Thermohalobaculum sp.]|nr:cupin domain-containing protein [Thermohalobaculum sp.]